MPFGRQHEVDGEQAEKPLRLFVLALIREPYAPLGVLLEKTDGHLT